VLDSAKRVHFNLANTLAGQSDDMTDLFERERCLALQAVPKPNDPSAAFFEGFNHFKHSRKIFNASAREFRVFLPTIFDHACEVERFSILHRGCMRCRAVGLHGKQHNLGLSMWEFKQLGHFFDRR
jgi:hypothetical protein